MQLQAQTERARQAKAVLENPLYKEAFQEVRDGLIALWERTPIKDIDARESAYLCILLLGRLRQELDRVIQGGKVAEAEIIELEQRKKRGLFR